MVVFNVICNGLVVVFEALGGGKRYQPHAKERSVRRRTTTDAVRLVQSELYPEPSSLTVHAKVQDRSEVSKKNCSLPMNILLLVAWIAHVSAVNDCKYSSDVS